MEWPAGLVEKMGYADTIYKVLSQFMKDGNAPNDEDSTEYHIIKRWVDYRKQKAREQRNV